MRHPLVATGLPWLVGAAFLSMWSWIWALILTAIPLDPALIPIIPGPGFLLACGLVVGAGLAVIRKRGLRKWTERIAHSWVHPRPLSRKRLALAIVAAVVIMGLDLWPGFWDEPWMQGLRLTGGLAFWGFIPAYGAAAMMQLFVYPEWMRVYRRARKIMQEETGEAPAADAKPGMGRGAKWATAVGYLSIVAVALTGVWWQWWLPGRATAEPGRFTVRSVAGGEAMRLTYGSGVWSASISPDGKTIAYVPVLMPYSSLQLMAANGKEKRRLGAGKTSVSPSWAAPQWSRDGTRLLVVGERPRGTRALLADWQHVGQSSDLWEVQAMSGRARRLTDLGDVTWGVWLIAGRMAMQRRVRQGVYSLWLMSEEGHDARQVQELPEGWRSTTVWGRGQELVLAGGPDSPGIWLVEAGSGKVHRLLGDKRDAGAPFR